MVLPLTTAQLKFLITWKNTANYPYRNLTEIYHISSFQFCSLYKNLHLAVRYLAVTLFLVDGRQIPDIFFPLSHCHFHLN